MLHDVVERYGLAEPGQGDRRGLRIEGNGQEERWENVKIKQ